MHLTHKIALVPTAEQEAYFRRAAGCARFVWNLALASWNDAYARGEHPSAMALKRAFNATKYERFPWMADIHRDAHAQPFTHLARAWSRFFDEVTEGATPAPHDPAACQRLRERGIRLAYRPSFKKKGRCRDNFYLANDKFTLADRDGAPHGRFPKVGWVRLTERPRFPGRILGATISRTATRWLLAVQVDVPDTVAKLKRTGDGIEGIDLGITAAATLSTGEEIPSPRPLKDALRRLKIRSRRLGRKVTAAKLRARFGKRQPLPKGTRLPRSANQRKAAERVASTHARIANLRADFTHKLTTRLCRENQALGLEDLHVRGMLANHRLARAISDIGFREIRRQFTYKSARYDNTIVLASRWYPSSKTCSVCGHVLDDLPLSLRTWTCPACGTVHKRDQNAATNLHHLAADAALPVANRPVRTGTATTFTVIAGGKVTPARDEIPVGNSGQEEHHAHLCAQF